MASSLSGTSLIVNGTQEITGISTTINNSNSEVPTSGTIYSRTPKTATVIIAPSDWNDGSCTKSVTGVTGSTKIISAPALSSIDNYLKAGIKLVSQGANSITFTCSSTPSNSIIINILVMKAILEGGELASLSITGNWTNPQYTNNQVDYTGLTFTATFNDGSTKSITPTSLSPSTWSSTAGTQSCTFSYTQDGVTVSASKSASVYRKLTNLTVGGSWTNTQYIGQALDTTGLTFTANYNNGDTVSVTPTVSPSTWSSTAGTQTATFSYSENGVTVSGTKNASVVVPSIALTGASSRTIVFYSISGNLYTDSACTTNASTNTKYTNKTFYYKANESKPSASYLYNYGDGSWSRDLPSKNTLSNYTTHMKTLFGTSGMVWSGTTSEGFPTFYYYYALSSSSWSYIERDSTSLHRVQLATL